MRLKQHLKNLGMSNAEAQRAMERGKVFVSGIPSCHGSGGIVGHHTFGGRTGGSVIIYGCLYIFLGLFLSQGFDTLVHIFPLPILGILLLFESLGLMLLVQDVTDSKSSFMIALLVGLISGGIQYGFVIGYLWARSYITRPQRVSPV